MKRTAQVIMTLYSSWLLTGCQMGYIVKSGYYQMQILSRKENFEKALRDPHIDEETKRKIRLVEEVKKFAEDKVGLVHTSNYESFVLLDDKYVTYALTASYKDRLESYTWSFPIVGRVPYKGYFKRPDAEKEKQALEKENLDVSLRGVSAYSTLGWFSDPLLSSMTQYEDEELVDTIIHETTHATLYIKSNADFNERFANFVGNKGMAEFYTAQEGPGSPKIKRAQEISADSKTFGDFITDQLKDLDTFYKENKGSPTLMADREKQFDKIKKAFTTVCLPRLKTDSYKYFSELKFNNALLLGYKTYYQDLGVFQKAFDKTGATWAGFLKYMNTLKEANDPEAELKAFADGPK